MRKPIACLHLLLSSFSFERCETLVAFLSQSRCRGSSQSYFERASSFCFLIEPFVPSPTAALLSLSANFLLVMMFCVRHKMLLQIRPELKWAELAVFCSYESVFQRNCLFCVRTLLIDSSVDEGCKVRRNCRLAITLANFPSNLEAGFEEPKLRSLRLSWSRYVLSPVFSTLHPTLDLRRRIFHPLGEASFQLHTLQGLAYSARYMVHSRFDFGLALLMRPPSMAAEAGTVRLWTRHLLCSINGPLGSLLHHPSNADTRVPVDARAAF